MLGADRNAPAYPPSEKLTIKDTAMGAHDSHDIFVRAHTLQGSQKDWSPKLTKWPRRALIFDTETTLDTAQKLNFGCFWQCELKNDVYECVQEGLFYNDSLGQKQLTVLREFVESPGNSPSPRRFPPQMQLGLLSRNDFVNLILWDAVRHRSLVVGFNLPFDLSRLAIKSANAKKNGWSLCLSQRTSRKTGEIEVDPERPRIVVTGIDSKLAFFKISSDWNQAGPQKDLRFLDLHTLVWALRNQSYSLDKACRKFQVAGKLKGYTASGRVTAKEIKYCREDVAATMRLLNAAKKEFDQHPIKLNPDGAYSPATIAKSYLAAMKISLPKAHFRIPNKTNGIAMQSYYGGRAECRIRKTKVPVVYTDFTSQYPTVNALLDNWQVLKSSSISFETCTARVRKMLSTVTLDHTFERSFWKDLSFFALVKPEKDILPVRTVYDGRTQNIGSNYLSSSEPIWYAGPDLVASKLLRGKAPKILKAIRMLPHGQQAKLESTNLRGMVEIKPREDDFFVRVIEQRSLHKPANKALADFLKVLANSGSYGLFVQVNPETLKKPKDVGVFSGTVSKTMSSLYIEKVGPWYFPPLAALITSGGRLLLAMLERCVKIARGSYLFCDTDSMCIVSTRNGSLIRCEGGKHKLNGKDAVKALSFKQVDSIAGRFKQLNPYNPSLVRDILKIEDINHVDADTKKPRRQLFGYAISAKRYALFTEVGNDISIVKASGHGLGYLFAPKEKKKAKNDEEDDEDEVPEWIVEAWDFLLRKELNLNPKNPSWLKLPAMMRMGMTSPNVMRNNRPEWLAPFNFFLFPLLSDLGGYPAGFDKSNFKFITPAEHDRRKWSRLRGLNLLDKFYRSYRIRMNPDGKQRDVVPESMRIILKQYLRHPEVKSLAPNGSLCQGDTVGLLRRAYIVAGEIVPIGKETDRHWEQGEDPSLIDFKVHEFRNVKKLMTALPKDIARWKRNFGVREMMRKANLAQPTVYAILREEPVRPRTLAIFKQAMDT